MICEEPCRNLLLDTKTWNREGIKEVYDLIDKETLKSDYLFPAIPYNKSLCEKVLSYQLISYSIKAESILSNIRNVTFELAAAFCNADLETEGTFELNPDNFMLLLSLNKPVKRIDGREFVYHNEIPGKKYVMACTLSVPDCCDSDAWDVATKSLELYAQRKDDFELVIFLRKRVGFEELLASIEDFLKPFDPSCVVVMLDDHFSGLVKDNQVLVIDPPNRVLLQNSLSFISGVGSAAFPFKEADLVCLSEQLWRLSHSSLETLLGVEPSFEFFRKIPGTDPLQEERRCISEFRSKIVFLYTYHHGNRLALLCDTVKGLREKGVEFEIITAYVPNCDYHNAPQFLEVFSSLVAKEGLSWWVVPYDSSTYPRLMPLYAYSTHTDQLIVFDPKFGDGDPHGLEVIKLYGQSMFPFTKESIVDHVIEDLSKVTLQSLLKHVNHLCKEGPEYDSDNVCENKPFPLSVLDDKDVLVYFEDYASGCAPLEQFVSWYNSLGETEKRRYNFEVVCVYLNRPEQQDDYNMGLRRQFPKWLISSDDDEKACVEYVVDNFFLKLFTRSTVVAFKKDGNICSLSAHHLLSSKAVTFPLKGDLRKEIFNIFNDYFTELLSYD